MPGGRIEVEVVPDVSQFGNKLQAGLKPAAGIAGAFGKTLGLAIAGGATVAAVGLKEVLRIGIDYQSQLNTLQSVTQATGLQMAQVGNLAKDLGADLSLPATSAGDAAAAMTELAKGGLSVNQAMTAAKGTLQLAAAAQVEAAQAAEIQSDALNQFGLSADKAGHVADVLANTANAASGEITDMANALKYVGPVARTIGVDIDNTATAIGLLAVNGIRGEQAGTSLRGILASLSSPSKEAAKALDVLGIKAFDSAGKFVGLRTITEQLAIAKGRLTEADFAAAASTAFGNEGLTAASSLANSGAKAYDEMATAVTRAGGAAEVAAAKTKGLGGAWEGLKSQLETTGIGIFEAIDGPLESVVRSAAKHVEAWNDEIVQGIETAVATGELFGPKLADAIGDRAGVVQAAVSDLLGPLAKGVAGPLNEALNAGIEGFDDLTGVLDNAVKAAKPVAEALEAVGEASAEGGGAASALGAGVGLATDALRLASTILVPVGNLIGGLVEGFASLPGPVQSAVVALVAFKAAQRLLGDTQALSGIRQFGGELRLQQGLASANGREIGVMSAAMAAYHTSTVPAVAAARSFTDQTAAVRAGAAAAGQPIGTMSAALGTLTERSPALSAMRTAFNDAAEGAGRFGVAAGTVSAGAVGLKAAASGLVGALGGPLGIAIAGAGVGLSLLAGSQEKAAAAAAEHKARVSSLADALRESNGVVTDSIRLSAAKTLADKKIFDSARELSIPVDLLTDAYLGQGDALTQVNGIINSYIKAVEDQGQLEGQVAGSNPMAQKAYELKKQLAELFPEFGKSVREANDLDAAMRSNSSSMLAATGSGRNLNTAIKEFGSNTATADGRVRSLQAALEALSGGNISLEAAQGRVQESLSRINDLFGEGLDKTKGYGDSLINAQGGLNLTTENGRRLRDVLQDLTQETADVAARTFDMARAQGDDIPTAAGKARAAMQQARDAFIGAHDAMQISAAQAEILADKAGLIPDNVAMVVSTPGSDQAKIELALVKSLVDRVPDDKPVTVRTLSDEAKRRLEEFGFKVTQLPDSKGFEIIPRTANAQSQLDSFIASNSNRSITVRINAVGAPISVRGQYGAELADGGLIKRFASGGFHKLTPMRGGLASIVPPNTWRVVGDRLRDDEAYIPINRSSRSVALLDETASRMGYTLARMWSTGGIATTSAAPAQPMSLDGMAITGRLRVDMDGYATLIDARVQSAMDAESREVRYKGGRP